MNIPKVALLFIGLGVASYALFCIAAALRNEISNELHLKQWYK